MRQCPPPYLIYEEHIAKLLTQAQNVNYAGTQEINEWIGQGKDMICNAYLGRQKKKIGNCLVLILMHVRGVNVTLCTVEVAPHEGFTGTGTGSSEF